MNFTWTPGQRQRLRELGASSQTTDEFFADTTERDRAFQEIERRLVQEGKNRLEELRGARRRPALCDMESRLVKALTASGFTQVVTPILLSRSLLERMTITEDHPLAKQVFWVDTSRCLRPMLAPHLYQMLVDLGRLWKRPVSIFEVGPCFRKETSGANHLTEFTMLNLVEMGLPESQRQARMEELASLVMETAGIKGYHLVGTDSEVYGYTMDIVCDIELGSGAMGPHRLDEAWGLMDTWVGIGFGLERLVMVKEGLNSVHKVGRSLSYLDGVRLNIE